MNADGDTTGVAETARADESVEDRLEASTGTERLVFFSDAVVAIAITLLALDLHVPKGTTNATFWHDAAAHGEDYLAFFISFVVIGSHWLLHHRTFSQVIGLAGDLTRWNMLWLMTIALTPFATRVVVGDGASPSRFMLYVLVQALAAVFSLLCLREIQRHRLLRPGTEAAILTRGYRRLGVMLAAFVVSMPLALVTHLAYLCWVAIPLVLRVERLVEARRRPRGVAA